MTELRRRRLEENQTLFRELNERIGATAEAQGGGVHAYEFVCECADIDCFARFELPLEDYRRVREAGERFLVVPGHERPEVEEVVERVDGIAVAQPRAAGEYEDASAVAAG